jgi:hypothetical protein
MSIPPVQRPDLPEYMTWEELELLPEEIAEQIELWAGRVVWVRRGPSEHQVFVGRLWTALERCARKDVSDHPQHCWRVGFETNVFLGRTGKSDFLTPDFLIHRCLESPYQDVRGDHVLLVGEPLGLRRHHSTWRRRHQYRAGISHYQRRSGQLTTSRCPAGTLAESRHSR